MVINNCLALPGHFVFFLFACGFSGNDTAKRSFAKEGSGLGPPGGKLDRLQVLLKAEPPSRLIKKPFVSQSPKKAVKQSLKASNRRSLVSFNSSRRGAGHNHVPCLLYVFQRASLHVFFVFFLLLLSLKGVKSEIA